MTDIETKLADALRKRVELWKGCKIERGDASAQATLKECIRQLECDLAAHDSARAQPASVAEGFARVIAALKRFVECCEDGCGADIGRDWFDALTTIGALERTQRSPAMWRMTPIGDAILAAAPQPPARRTSNG